MENFMRKYMQFILQFKFVWGSFFTASIILYTFINMFLGKTSMDFVTVWQFVFITIILTFIYYLAFSELIIRTLQTKYRILIHFLLSYITLLIGAYLLQWLDLSKLSRLGVFTLGCIILYLCACFSFFMYYKLTGEQLNNKLAMYKKMKNRGVSK